MKTTQSCYHCIENIGDVNPFEHGGAFVCVDKFNVYSPILLILDPFLEHPTFTHRLLEITLDRCFYVKQEDEIIGIGSNPYHTDMCEWFGNLASLETVASFTGGEGYDSFMRGFVCSDPIERAFSYKSVADYYGVHEFDQYPRELTEEKAKLFCDKMFEQMQDTKSWWQGYFEKEVN
jgi:hypothetical protein